MQQSNTMLSMVAVCICLTITSAGIVDRIPSVPNAIKSYFIKTTDAFNNQNSYEMAIFNDNIPTAVDNERSITNLPSQPSFGNQNKRRRPVSRRKPSTSPRRRSTTKNVKSSPLPVTGAHATISTNNGEVVIFASQGRLWLNATSLDRPVPLGFAKDTDSISIGNKNAHHIWVNTTSWNKLVSLDEVAAGRRSIVLYPGKRRQAVHLNDVVVRRTPLHTDIVSSDYVRPTAVVQPERGTYQYDTCGLNIVVPLTADRIVLREQSLKPSYKSTGFPGERDYPLVCTWNVKVNKMCRRARITMKVDGRSRLPDVEGCAKGYLHVAPFMNGTKVCGPIGSIQPYHWYVEDQEPQHVTITMKNIGINDGHSEGVSFTLQGECLPIERGPFDVDKENVESNINWMDRLAKETAATGYGATLAVVPSLNLAVKKPSLSESHPDDGNRRVNLTYNPAVVVDQLFDEAISYITTLLNHEK